MDAREVAATGDGDTDFDVDDVAVLIGSDGSASILPASLKRLDPDARAAIMAVARRADELRHMLDHLHDAVDHARDLGASWSAVGWVLGTTGEGARKRFRDHS